MDDSKFLILGSNGQLGKALAQKYPKARTADIDELDITDDRAVAGYDWSGIEVILNAAAYTNVDGAETKEGRETAWKVNANAVETLAGVAATHNIVLVHISTEYVFDGTKNNHKEDESLSPLGVYAKTKAAGEIAAAQTPKHYICRTSWLIGDGHNFVRTMMSLAQKNISPTVVSDQIGRLTFTGTLVETIDHLLKSRAGYGVYNVTNDGQPASWAEITRNIFKIMDRNDLTVTDTTTQKYFKDKPNTAPRPLLSSMNLSKIKSTGVKLNDWHQELIKYVQQEMKK